MSDHEPFCHARSVRSKLVAYNLNHGTRPTDREPHSDYIQPNDRGALLSVETFRLPLDRHVCAETLWRFFGDMGERNDGPVETWELLEAQESALNASRNRIFYELEARTHELLEFPSFAANQDFSNLYCLHLYHHAKQQVIAFTQILFGSYYFFLKMDSNPPLVVLQNRPWDEEIRLKRSSKWILRMDGQYKIASVHTALGDSLFSKGQIGIAKWCYLRALMEMCPWYPTGWYMTPDQGTPLSAVLYHCLNRLTYVCWRLSCNDGDFLGRTIARHVYYAPFASRSDGVVAKKLLSAFDQPIDSGDIDRTASLGDIVGNLNDTSVEEARYTEVSYGDVNFSPIDVVRWASERYEYHQVKSDVWDFSKVSLGTIVRKGEEEWRKVYGEDKPLYTWEGTEDEALGPELGSGQVDMSLITMFRRLV